MKLLIVLLALAAPDARGERDRGALGLVLPQDAADVAALVAGTVIEVPVRIGDRVRAGDLLVSLDASLPAASVDAAQATLRADRANYEVALAQSRSAAARAERVAALFAKNLTSKEDLENAERDRNVARLKADALRASLAERQAQIARLSAERRLFDVRAPFEGTVVARYVEPGAAVSASAARPIVRLISADRLFVRFAASRRTMSGLELGMRIRIRGEDSGAEAFGVVERIAPEIDPATKVMIAEARLLDGKPVLVAGEVVRVFAAGK